MFFLHKHDGRWYITTSHKHIPCPEGYTESTKVIDSPELTKLLGCHRDKISATLGSFLAILNLKESKKHKLIDKTELTRFLLSDKWSTEAVEHEKSEFLEYLTEMEGRDTDAYVSALILMLAATLES